MIRMTRLPVGKYHDPRPRFAKHARYLEPVFPSVLDAAIWDVECLPPRSLQDSGCVAGFPRTVFRGAARAHLALCQIQNAGAMPALRHLEQSTATSLLHIVAMRGNGQNVER